MTVLECWEREAATQLREMGPEGKHARRAGESNKRGRKRIGWAGTDKRGRASGVWGVSGEWCYFHTHSGLCVSVGYGRWGTVRKGMSESAIS